MSAPLGSLPAGKKLIGMDAWRAPVPRRRPQATVVPARASKRAAARISNVKLNKPRLTSKLKLSFRLSRAANVRLVLEAKTAQQHKFAQLAAKTVHGKPGNNTFAVGSKWKHKLVPHRATRVLVQLKPAEKWITKKTIRLAAPALKRVTSSITLTKRKQV